MDSDVVQTVHAWHTALNAGDVDRLVALSSNDVEVGGPRGTGHGAQLLRDWFDRAGIHIEPKRIFHRGNTVVVDQAATWHITGGRGPAEPQAVASVFVVRDGRVSSVIRHADLASALQAGGLTYSDKV
jgi:ketosteroid isomerase-like protein